MSRAACDEVEALNVTEIGKSRDWEAPESQMGLLPSLCHGYGRWRGRVGEAESIPDSCCPLAVETATTLRGS